MVKVIVSENCGNSPKSLLLRDFNIAVAKGNLPFVERNITEDITWHLFEPARQKQIRGISNVLKEYRQNPVIVPIEFIIDNVITHGDRGAVNGTIKAKDGKLYIYCNIYKFSSHQKTPKSRK